MERISEGVRKYSVLYDKADRYFKDKANLSQILKKSLGEHILRNKKESYLNQMKILIL